jgi:AcrR family transcriptional regulator
MNSSGYSVLSRPYRRKIKTQRAIREAAFALFSLRGYKSVSIDDIAASAGVSRTTFFNYFSSKEGIVTDADLYTIAFFDQLIAARQDEEPWWQALSHVLIDLVDGSGDLLSFKKRLKLMSPEMTHLFQKSSAPFVQRMLVWLENRDAVTDKEFGRLQVHVAMAVLETLYDAWDMATPHTLLTENMQAYYALLAPAFTPTSGSSQGQAAVCVQSTISPASECASPCSAPDEQLPVACAPSHVSATPKVLV